MNRIIKFRVFAGYKMEYFGLGDTVPYYYKDENSSATKYEPVMQFTGLYDKNGKEIYEGDIIIPTTGTFKGYKMYIKFCDIELCFYAQFIGTIGNEKKRLRITKNKKFEVIGNMYENLE